MTIEDRIYGRLTIDNPVIVDLISSKPMQRIRHISSDGSVHFLQPIRNVTRFEHCVGVWYLSSKYNRPIEEQIASLLHDTPHTAFSHVIDFVMETDNQDYHESLIHKIILESDVPAILMKHHIDVDKVLDISRYYLLDNKTPELSVDRWDYFMRDGYSFGLLPIEDIQRILQSVRERDEHFYFDDLRIASLFSIMTTMVTRLIYLDPASHGSWSLLANAIKLGLKYGIISEQDLLQTDDYVWDKLKAAHNEEVDAYLNRLNPSTAFHYAPKGKAEFYGPNKPRYVDPIVLKDSKFSRVSELIPGYAEYLDEFKERCRFIGVLQV